MSWTIHKLNGLGMESNAYLISSRKPALVDVGTGARLEETLVELHELLGKRKLASLVLTHMHFDHTGGAAALVARTGAEAFAHDPDAGALEKGDGKLTCSGWLGEKQAPFRISTVAGGDFLDCGDVKFEVLHTPGHTAGCLCLFDKATGTLLSGDTVFTNGGVGRWDLPTGNRSELHSSLSRLAKLPVRSIYPGHGPYYEEDGKSHIALGLEMVRTFEG